MLAKAWPLVVAAVVFAWLAAAFFVSAREVAASLGLFAMRRLDGGFVLKLLASLERIERAAIEGRYMLRGKIMQLVTLTGLIWVAELATIALITGGGLSMGLPGALLAMFTHVLAGVAPAPASAMESGLPYLALVGLVLFPLGLIAAIVYAPWRWRLFRSNVRRLRRNALISTPSIT